MPTIISGSVMRLRAKSPFFAVLAMHASWIEDERFKTIATNGIEVRYNLTFLEGKSTADRDFIVAHEVAHVALRHPSRVGLRNPVRWNIAADIVVNGMLVDQGLKLPSDGVSHPKLAHLKVEDVYIALGDDPMVYKEWFGTDTNAHCRDLCSPVAFDGSTQQAQPAQQDTLWRQALQRARTAQRLHDNAHNRPTRPTSQDTLNLLNPQVDWRNLLWRFMGQTPTNYQGFDRRFVHSGQYIDYLQGQGLTVAVCVDTSGSISAPLLQAFMSELQGILAAHPHIKMKLYFADSHLYGPWWVTSDGHMPTPQGGGGTDFIPFFEAIAESLNQPNPVDLIIYQTDGYGRFPPHQPETPVMWCVPDDALTEADFPWGEVTRLPAA